MKTKNQKVPASFKRGMAETISGNVIGHLERRAAELRSEAEAQRKEDIEDHNRERMHGICAP